MNMRRWMYIFMLFNSQTAFKLTPVSHRKLKIRFVTFFIAKMELKPERNQKKKTHTHIHQKRARERERGGEKKESGSVRITLSSANLVKWMWKMNKHICILKCYKWKITWDVKLRRKSWSWARRWYHIVRRHKFTKFE